MKEKITKNESPTHKSTSYSAPVGSSRPFMIELLNAVS